MKQKPRQCRMIEAFEKQLIQNSPQSCACLQLRDLHMPVRDDDHWRGQGIKKPFKRSRGKLYQDYTGK